MYGEIYQPTPALNYGNLYENSNILKNDISKYTPEIDEAKSVAYETESPERKWYLRMLEKLKKGYPLSPDEQRAFELYKGRISGANFSSTHI